MKLSKIILLFMLVTVNIYGNIYASTCTAISCEGVTLPSSARKFIEKGYEHIEVSVLDNDKYLYLSTESDVNKCSVIFKFHDDKIEDIPFAGEDGNLCNISKVNGNIVSSWRDKGVWYNDIYQVLPGKKWVLLFTDSCVDCQQVKRIYYKNGIVSHEVLMTGGHNHETRKPLYGIISVQKAPLYSNPDEEGKTKAYLVKNDEFALVNMSDDGSFYKINYKSSLGKEALYWIKSDDFEVK